MTAGEIASLVTAITALISAFGAVLAQLRHIHWHASAAKPTQAVPQQAPGAPEKQ